MQNCKTSVGTTAQKSTTVEANNVNPQLQQCNVSGSGFRIVELDGIFKIERRFKRVTKTGCLWWSKKVEDYVWKEITIYGGECFRVPMYGTGIVIDTYKYKMPEFTTLEEAEKTLTKLINPPKPVYYYR